MSRAEFIQRVIKDDQGDHIILGSIHFMWMEFITETWAQGKWAFVLAPFGHGKSTLIAVALPLFELSSDPNVRIKIVCNTDDNARLRMRALARYIERDNDFKDIAPWVRPALKESWTKGQLFVERSSAAAEPSVSAAGVLSSMPGRIDMLVADDIVDRKNAILSPGMRATVHDNFREAWLSRLTPHAKMVYICSVWHRQDATHRMLLDPALDGRFRALIQRVSDDLTHIENYVME